MTGSDGGELRRRDVAADPFVQFLAWYDAASAAGLEQPDAMALATSTPDGRPSLRMVLLKGVDHGFVFYTNGLSRKGRDLAANPRAALAFYWQPLHRQVRISGAVEPVTEEESEAYFASRPRGAQLAAAASNQSSVVANRAELLEAFQRLEREHEGPVARPSHWGGYRLIPEEFEFWQSRENRLHDRFRYARDPATPEAWRIDRLAP